MDSDRRSVYVHGYLYLLLRGDALQKNRALKLLRRIHDLDGVMLMAFVRQISIA